MTILGFKDELQKINYSIKNNKNVFIFGNPYQGKTALLTEATKDITPEESILLYLDCRLTFTAKNFLETCTSVLMKNLSVTVKDLNLLSQKYLPQITPGLNVVPGQGVNLSMNYNITAKDITKFTRQFFSSLDNIQKDFGKKIIIVFDNFHELYHVENAAIIKIIKETLSQNHTYIFTCSDEKITKKIFPKKDPAAFDIQTMIYLEKLPLNIIYFYINQTLHDNNIKMTENVIDRIISITRG